MPLVKKYWLVIAGAIIGLASGYLYWYEIGCATGTCPITSSPVNSSLYGAMMGGLLFSMLKKENSNSQK